MYGGLDLSIKSSQGPCSHFSKETFRSSAVYGTIESIDSWCNLLSKLILGDYLIYVVKNFSFKSPKFCTVAFFAFSNLVKLTGSS